MAFYKVTIERTAECPTAVVREHTTVGEFPTLWPRLLDEVWAFLNDRPGLRTDGHNVMLYAAGDGPDELAVEVGVQVTGAFESAGRVVPSVLPATEVATALHSGKPADIGEAHVAVRAWCAARGHRLSGLSWEIYGDPDPGTGHFDVEVYWQLA